MRISYNTNRSGIRTAHAISGNGIYDFSESNDLVATNPSRVRKLNCKLEKWLLHTGAKMPVKKE